MGREAPPMCSDYDSVTVWMHDVSLGGRQARLASDRQRSPVERLRERPLPPSRSIPELTERI